MGSERMSGQASGSIRGVGAKAAGAGSRMAGVGGSDACQSAGSSVANEPGAQGKAQSPALCHHRLLLAGVSPRTHDVLIVAPIAGIAPEKLLCKSGLVEKASIAIA